MSVSDEIIKVIDVLAKRIGIAIDWTSENVVPYLETLCSKYVNYEITTSVIWIVIGLCFIPVFLYLYKKLEKNKNFGIGSYDDHMGRYLAYVGVFLILFAIVHIVTIQIFDVATCITFPEKVIFDELKTLYSTIK